MRGVAGGECEAQGDDVDRGAAPRRDERLASAGIDADASVEESIE